MERTGYTPHELEWGMPYVTVMVMVILAQEAQFNELTAGALKGAFG